MTQLPPTIPGPMQPMYSREAPGATASMVIGIICIVINIPIVSLIIAIVGLQKAKEAKAAIDLSPGYYTNAGVAQAGFVLCIVAICLDSLGTLCGCGYFAIIAMAIMGGAAGASSGGGGF